MKMEAILSQSPKHVQDSPFFQAMSKLMQSQAKQIQSQAEQIQSQAEQIQSQTEQIVKLKEIVESLKDEISRLNKTPKRPKFKSNNMEPRNRGKKKNSITSEKNKNICAPEKKYEEIKISVDAVPLGSRFKGYATFTGDIVIC